MELMRLYLPCLIGPKMIKVTSFIFGLDHASFYGFLLGNNCVVLLNVILLPTGSLRGQDVRLVQLDGDGHQDGL